MRADRLLSAILLLQAHGKLSARALADRLEVSLRTVHRDMEALGIAGVPIFATRGAQGGWQLDEHWRTRVPAFDTAELQALLLSQPRAIGDPHLAASAERALTKLLAALPVTLRAQAETMRQRLYVDPTGWRGVAERLHALPVVQEAVSRDRVITIDYRAPGREPSSRTVRPLGLVAKGTNWYLVADTDAGLRTFRVSRIDHAVMLDRSFTRPPRFDLVAAWNASTEAYRRAKKYETTLRADAAAVDNLRTYCRVVTESPRPDRRVTLKVDFDGEDDACFVVLGLGTGVEVVEPAALRKRVAASVSAAYARLPGRARRKRAEPRS
jgi:predicted DNA-binding transcriptional regulator YafY